MIRVLIVDDHPVVRAGLASMLSTYPELQVVGSATDGSEALAMLDTHAVDVILLDLRMPRMNGVETLQALKARANAPRVLVLTSYESNEDVYQSIRAGAYGYLLKASSEEEMIRGIQTVYAGERYLPMNIATRLADRVPRSHLNSRQMELLDLIASELTDVEVARKLHIEVEEVWTQLNTIIETLGTADENQAGRAGSLPATKITIADVARKAGVSMATVSRVLHNKGKHTEETRRAVMKVVKEYDFQLNGTAASLAMMRSPSLQSDD